MRIVTACLLASIEVVVEGGGGSEEEEECVGGFGRASNGKPRKICQRESAVFPGKMETMTSRTCELMRLVRLWNGCRKSQ